MRFGIAQPLPTNAAQLSFNLLRESTQSHLAGPETPNIGRWEPPLSPRSTFRCGEANDRLESLTDHIKGRDDSMFAADIGLHSKPKKGAASHSPLISLPPDSSCCFSVNWMSQLSARISRFFVSLVVF